ncbi:CDP-glycerol glycerophosphotransferase family protein [Lactiplantibacillus pentosus]|uniref:CDP-glycerol glycerophosphotransferase family protein n=1 Tax=Lactobacillaceae TaxID=33958 RepID=UPI001C1F7C37|nr:CDP-glycerol glycerophosphotransferase family protein [Lactiplantibacillus pentosus]MBU7465876.1 CDP-glycerol glycerophosphotransferase family protein [Lactiplantibacillus pentosus]MDT7002289.1 CDP-glycerol glycerophosphotransferase family protein [Lactiplantibacillus pentosus]
MHTLVSILRAVLLNILYFVSGFSIRNPKLIIFGAWFGRRYSDNPRYLLEEIIANQKYDSYRLVWIGNKNICSEITNPRVKFIKRGSLLSLWAQLRSGTSFFSHGFEDFGHFNLLRNSTTMQLWHGFPIKHIGADDPGNGKEGIHYFQSYTYFLADSLTMKERMMSGFRYYGANEKNVLITPQPRVDFLAKHQHDEILVDQLKKKLGLDAKSLIVTYLPTFRDNTQRTFSFFKNTTNDFKQFLKEQNIIILERQHFARMGAESQNTIVGEVCKDIPESLDVQSLQLISDILITDYSSVYVDFLTLNRPIIHFLYDYDEYLKHDRGIYSANFENEIAGPVAYDENDLKLLLANRLEISDSNRVKFCEKVQLKNAPIFFDEFFEDVILRKVIA